MLVEFHITTRNKATTRMVHMPIPSSFPSTLAMGILLILFFDQPSKMLDLKIWYPKQPCLTGCFNWMMNQTFTLLIKWLFHYFHPLKKGCSLEFQDVHMFWHLDQPTHIMLSCFRPEELLIRRMASSKAPEKSRNVKVTRANGNIFHQCWK